MVQFVSSNVVCVLQWYARKKTLDVEGAHVSTLWHAAIADGVVKLKAVLHHELAELRQHRLKVAPLTILQFSVAGIGS